jgi:hypothetical protein
MPKKLRRADGGAGASSADKEEDEEVDDAGNGGDDDDDVVFNKSNKRKRSGTQANSSASSSSSSSPTPFMGKHLQRDLHKLAEGLPAAVPFKMNEYDALSLLLTKSDANYLARELEVHFASLQLAQAKTRSGKGKSSGKGRRSGPRTTAPRSIVSLANSNVYYTGVRVDGTTECKVSLAKADEAWVFAAVDCLYFPPNECPFLNFRGTAVCYTSRMSSAEMAAAAQPVAAALGRTVWILTVDAYPFVNQPFAARDFNGVPPHWLSCVRETLDVLFTAADEITQRRAAGGRAPVPITISSSPVAAEAFEMLSLDEDEVERGVPVTVLGQAQRIRFTLAVMMHPSAIHLPTERLDRIRTRILQIYGDNAKARRLCKAIVGNQQSAINAVQTIASNHPAAFEDLVEMLRTSEDGSELLDTAFVGLAPWRRTALLLALTQSSNAFTNDLAYLERTIPRAALEQALSGGATALALQFLCPSAKTAGVRPSTLGEALTGVGATLAMLEGKGPRSIFADIVKREWTVTGGAYRRRSRDHGRPPHTPPSAPTPRPSLSPPLRDVVVAPLGAHPLPLTRPAPSLPPRPHLLTSHPSHPPHTRARPPSSSRAGKASMALDGYVEEDGVRKSVRARDMGEWALSLYARNSTGQYIRLGGRRLAPGRHPHTPAWPLPRPPFSTHLPPRPPRAHPSLPHCAMLWLPPSALTPFLSLAPPLPSLLVLTSSPPTPLTHPIPARVLLLLLAQARRTWRSTATSRRTASGRASAPATRVSGAALPARAGQARDRRFSRGRRQRVILPRRRPIYPRSAFTTAAPLTHLPPRTPRAHPSLTHCAMLWSPLGAHPFFSLAPPAPSPPHPHSPLHCRQGRRREREPARVHGGGERPRR